MDLQRSLLFVPGDDPDRIDAARDSDASDVIVVDLEDSVRPAAKDEARERAIQTLAAVADADRPWGVRVNGLDTARGVADIEALATATATPDFLVLPDVYGVADVHTAFEALDRHDADVELLPLVERPRAVFDVHALANADDRIFGLLFAAIDFQLNMGMSIFGESDVAAPRALIAMAASSAGVLAFDMPDLTMDPATTRREAETAKRLGYDGKLAASLAQAEIINDVFAPAPEEVERARRIATAWDDADAGIVEVDGRLVDKPVVDQAVETLARAEAAGVGSGDD